LAVIYLNLCDLNEIGPLFASVLGITQCSQCINTLEPWTCSTIHKSIKDVLFFCFCALHNKARNVGQAINVKGSGRLSYKNLLSRFEFWDLWYRKLRNLYIKIDLAKMRVKIKFVGI